MNSRHAAIRRVLFWTAMLAGAALVGLQFACDRPQTAPSTAGSTAGFPHAGRWPMQPAGPPQAPRALDLEPVSWWISPKPSGKPLRQAASRLALPPPTQARLTPAPEGTD